MITGFQKYGNKVICKGGFLRADQDTAAGWTGLAVLSCRYVHSSESHHEISLSWIFLQYPNQEDINYHVIITVKLGVCGNVIKFVTAAAK